MHSMNPQLKALNMKQACYRANSINNFFEEHLKKNAPKKEPVPPK